jgi:hypothetical protein
MTKDDFFALIRAGKFFDRIEPGVPRFYHKMRGIDGNGHPLDFTPEEKQAMKDEAKKLAKELQKVKF